MSRPTCYAELFELSDLSGRQHRLAGPGSFAPIRSIGGRWGLPFESIHASRGTYLRFYSSFKPSETLSWLLPGGSIRSINAVGSLREFDSFDIYCSRPPADCPGYDLLVLIERMAQSD